MEKTSLKLTFLVLLILFSSGSFSTVLGVEGKVCRSLQDCPICERGQRICDLGFCGCLGGGVGPPPLRF
ncbi:hypothetical protein SLEP1_g21992 [Rubroshorea leprosula]|uniref:Uncharacterized protein n=1 Tax=Rubroshorea leprosula TaxID=152421 RepID=A0AAV5J7T0_9ROSI|nr:hypothetical protein SLEP1_g21992 [Rubroshorea leprosula]